MKIKTFFDEQTFTFTHMVYDPSSRDALIIDPVLDLDTVGWITHTTSLQRLDDFIEENNLKVKGVVDTHIHADHLTGMQYLKARYKAPLMIHSAIGVVQQTFQSVFNFDAASPIDGRQFDRLLNHGEHIEAGTLTFDVLHIPGHTPACSALKIEDAVFTGDALFNPDIGTGRCDFPKGSAVDLYDSVTQKLYTLPDDTRVFPGHDYPGSRALQMQTSIKESKAHNIDLPASRDKDDYVAFMNDRDSRLSLPRLIYPSVQINMAAGLLPEAQTNGTRYLKIPISGD